MDEKIQRGYMSKPHVTADTNIFYYLGDGSLKRKDIVSSSEELWAAPINILEIISSREDFSKRVSAARAILAADNIDIDPNEYLASLLEGRSPIADNNWKTICEALATATSEEKLWQTIDIAWAVDERCKEYAAFYCRTIHMCDKSVPGYTDACFRKTQPPRMTKELREDFRKSIPILRQSRLQDYVSWRIAEEKKKNSGASFSATVEIEKAVSDVYNSYITMYIGYAEKLLVEGAKPDINDWGDLELFKHLHSGHYVVTAEKKWVRIAEKAGLKEQVRIRKPKIIKI